MIILPQGSRNLFVSKLSYTYIKKIRITFTLGEQIMRNSASCYLTMSLFGVDLQNVFEASVDQNFLVKSRNRPEMNSNPVKSLHFLFKILPLIDLYNPWCESLQMSEIQSGDLQQE